MHVTHLHNADDLAALTDDWNRLAAGNPFRRSEWLVTWWRAFARPEWELFVLVVRDEAERVVLIAPWYVEPSLTRGRVVKFLGSNDVCTDHLSILADPIQEQPAIAALAGWLTTAATQPTPAAEPQRAWDLIELVGIDAGDRPASRLFEQLEARGNTVEQRTGMSCWIITLGPTWDAYLARLGKTHRRLIRQLTRTYIETGRADLRWAESEAAVERLWPTLVDLHQRRRQMLGQSGCFSDPAFEAFLKEASLGLYRAGLMRLAHLTIDGRNAGVELLFREGDTLHDYNGGIEPDLLDTEPGRILKTQILKHMLREGYKHFDLLRGDEPYKAHARAEPRATREVHIVPRNVLSQWRHSVWNAGVRVKDWVKSRFGLVASS